MQTTRFGGCILPRADDLSHEYPSVFRRQIEKHCWLPHIIYMCTSWLYVSLDIHCIRYKNTQRASELGLNKLENKRSSITMSFMRLKITFLVFFVLQKKRELNVASIKHEG